MKKLINIVGVSGKGDPAFLVTLQFLLFGITWILFSDASLSLLGPENLILSISHIQTLKGLLFVGLTGAFMFYWTSRFVNSAKQKESELSTLFQNCPLPMGIVDSSTFQFLEVNDSLMRLYNYDKAEFLSLRLETLSVEKERYEEFILLIKTGSKETGVWKQYNKSHDIFSVQICAQPVRDRKAWLIMFVDVTNEVAIRDEMKRIKKAFEDRLNERTDHLHRINEELAYRESQTEHVNTELIAVNERLQIVNKRIATQMEESVSKNKSLHEILHALEEAVWSFDLTLKRRNYISPSAETMFEESATNLNSPWFWFDYIHPEDEALKETNHERLLEKGECSATLRIVTRKGTVKLVYFRIKLVRDANKASLTLIGSASDVSNVRPERQTPMLVSQKVG